jgi:hypothetical protein
LRPHPRRPRRLRPWGSGPSASSRNDQGSPGSGSH